MQISKDVKYVGVNDREIRLFEGQYKVEGMSYNSYVILDEKIAVLDTVEAGFFHEWMTNVKNILGDKSPDYLIVSHMEPDHSANIFNFMNTYKDAVIVGNTKTFTMIQNFFGTDFAERRVVVAEGDTLNLGTHELTFIMAPMVHWPEVMMTYDKTDKILFSADGFGRFGHLDDGKEWIDQARRYYIGIVGKYGVQVQAVLKKAAGLTINAICPLHGPVLTENLNYYLGLYDVWSSFKAETEGTLIAYTSIYGNTKKAVLSLKDKLIENGCPEVKIVNLSTEDMKGAVADAFKYSHLILATTTYNGTIFPFMSEFISHLLERGYKNRTVGFIENGSWAPVAARKMKEMFADSKGLTFTENVVTLLSSYGEKSAEQVDALAKEICANYPKDNIVKVDEKSLFNIGYGLYVVTTNLDGKDNGLIVNTVTQLSSSPLRVSVAISKQNYSHYIVKTTEKLNVNCLSENAPFSLFQNYGFKSGLNSNKFEGVKEIRSNNGLRVLPEYANAFLSLKVESYEDLGSHGLFICSVTQSETLNKEQTMTYNYYQKNVKLKPQTDKKGFACKICGYVYEGGTLPSDFVCPICKHPASDFEPIK